VRVLCEYAFICQDKEEFLLYLYNNDIGTDKFILLKSLSSYKLIIGFYESQDNHLKAFKYLKMGLQKNNEYKLKFISSI